VVLFLLNSARALKNDQVERGGGKKKPLKFRENEPIGMRKSCRRKKAKSAFSSPRIELRRDSPSLSSARSGQTQGAAGKMGAKGVSKTTHG